ncbi:hypothetical protein VFPPC_03666 [Pochonia chlamydosporia 170]|uniref:MARVEL domain-containing protein n=1 Tax=Pochonia chlamydosporia 170 TaxID=1380566 RepID=A0A179G0B7_METCM|nr:hypothetical protein VFPPC_03666 [Pochonia chlamydosporia 170]OAQ71354.1 hypothetical protein VFPPC_03666 [Pochonia chlamydosporia 170]
MYLCSSPAYSAPNSSYVFYNPLWSFYSLLCTWTQYNFVTPKPTMLGPQVCLGFARILQLHFIVAVLVINSVFLGKLNAFDLPVDQNILLVEGFAATALVWNMIGLFMIMYAGKAPATCVLIFMELFVMGSFSFIAVVSKAGTGTCTHYGMPFGSPSKAGMPSIGEWCGMHSANLGISIAAVVISFGCVVAELTARCREHYH